MKKISFNVRGEERKKLVNAISESMRVKPVYMGTPTFQYNIFGRYGVGKIIVTRNGDVLFDDSFNLLMLMSIIYRLVMDGYFGLTIEEAEP